MERTGEREKEVKGDEGVKGVKGEKGDKKKEDIYNNNVYKELKLYSLWLYIRIKKRKGFII